MNKLATNISKLDNKVFNITSDELALEIYVIASDPNILATSRIAAYKLLAGFTGGFEADKTVKIDHTSKGNEINWIINPVDIKCQPLI